MFCPTCGNTVQLETEDDSTIVCSSCGEDVPTDSERFFEFHLILNGKGANQEEAWEDAVETFTADPGFPDDEQIKEVPDPEIDPESFNYE